MQYKEIAGGICAPKGFAAAGYRHYMGKGVLLSVENHELPEVVGLAKKFDDLKMPMYATADTASAIRSLGIQVHEIPPIVPGSEAYQLMEAGKIGLIVYTGALYDDTIREYIELHREAVRHSIASITALDTANAMANMKDLSCSGRNEPTRSGSAATVWSRRNLLCRRSTPAAPTRTLPPRRKKRSPPRNPSPTIM